MQNSSAKTIALLGALDTKEAEYAFVQQCIRARGHQTLLIDTGVMAKSQLHTDVASDEVAREGGGDLLHMAQTKDRGSAMAIMMRGATVVRGKLFAAKRFDGVLALGGTSGTSVATAAMRAMPLGIPKVMVSTCAGGDVSGYVGVKDIVMIPSIVDVAGINKISREVFSRAAGAICGMVEAIIPPGQDGFRQGGRNNSDVCPTRSADHTLRV